MERYTCIAPCIFGLEKLVADELRQMQAQDVAAQNGRVLFSGGPELIARANLGSRCAERIQLRVGGFAAHSFTELFDGTKSLPWEEFIGRHDAFPVKGWSLQSTLHSVPDCQAIVKKAVVERLKQKYRLSWFEETGPARQISVSILKDEVTLAIDTSGEGLHKRGYRRTAGEAPLKETLAAAMAYLSRLYPDSTVYDPFCGSGTILIESALLARNIAPGLRRSFAAEQFDFLPQQIWRRERARAQELIRADAPFRAVGSDIDPQAVALTRENARRAGLSGCVSAEAASLSAFAPEGPRGVVITNPPYGERLLDARAAEELCREMGRKFPQRHGWRYTVISPQEEFERLFGRPADKRRKVYNGMMKCQLYFYFRSSDGEHGGR